MSRETATWLNNNTLIGFTAKRGHAWHYRAELQGDEPNHYAGAVPIEDVRRRLFNYEAESTPIFLADPMSPMGFAEVPGKQAIVHSRTRDLFGVFGEGYRSHQFQAWLLDTVANIIDDGLSIGSAGILKRGAVAWVSVEVPDTITTPEGVSFRPNLLACSSHDGSLATTFKPVTTNTVCDNTMAIALREKGEKYSVKHTRNSSAKIADARQALNIVHEIADDFTAQVAELSRIDVTPKQWAKFVDMLAPMPEADGRGKTLAENKRDELQRLWVRDERVAPWQGTAWGVVQAVNTYTHHSLNVRGAERAERNMLRAVTGGVDKLDTDTMSLLRKALVAA